MRAAGGALIFAAAIGVASGTSSQVHALSCGGAAPNGTLPGPLDAAPLNTHFWVSLPSDWEKLGVCPAHAAKPDACVAGRFTIELRRAAVAKRPATRVEAQLRVARADREHVVEVVPTQALEPRAGYEVWMVDLTKRVREHLLGTFRAGAHNDLSPPRWNGLTKGSYDPPRDSRGAQLRVHLDAWSVETTPIVLHGDPASDDGGEEHVRYAIWAVPEGQRIDYTKPPITFEAAMYAQKEKTRLRTDVLLFLGGSGSCDSGPTYAIPTDPSVLRIGVRAVDRAGNMSPVSEVSVKLR